MTAEAVRIDEDIPQVSMHRSWSDGDLAQLCEDGGLSSNGREHYPPNQNDRDSPVALSHALLDASASQHM